VPNHCESDLHVHGDPEALKAFMEFAQGPGGTGKEPVKAELLSAHKFIPYPEEYDTDRMECTKCAHQFPRDPGGDAFPNCPSCGGSAKDGTTGAVTTGAMSTGERSGGCIKWFWKTAAPMTNFWNTPSRAPGRRLFR
jgi:hypothetical protein